MKTSADIIFPHGLKGIIFDCDGVMIDSAHANRFLYNFVLARLGLPPMTREQELYAFQATFQDALRRLVPEERQTGIPEIVNGIDYDKDVASKVELMPGFLAFMEEAHSRHIRMAIDTNRTDFGIDRILDIFELPKYFDPVITSSIAPEPKPSPAGVEMILKSWQTAPDCVLFVGDSEDDEKAATGANVKFAAFGPNRLEGVLKTRSWPDLARQLWNI